MSFQKLKSNSCCSGQKHSSGTKNNNVEKTINKNTGKEIKLLVGQCVICNRENFMIVSDNTIKAEEQGSFLKKNLGKISAKAGKKLATNVRKNPDRALNNTANIATAAASRNLKQLYQHYLKFSNFTTGKGLYLGKIV